MPINMRLNIVSRKKITFCCIIMSVFYLGNCILIIYLILYFFDACAYNFHDGDFQFKMTNYENQNYLSVQS